MIVSRTQAEQAADTLQVRLEGLGSEALGIAYRVAAKTCHPDTGNHDALKWAAISKARDVLVQWLVQPGVGDYPAAYPGTLSDGCRACGGKGYTQSVAKGTFRLGPRIKCVLCDGEGRR